MLLMYGVMSQECDAQTQATHPCLRPSSIAIFQTIQAPKGRYVSSDLESLIETIAVENKLTIWCDRRLAKDTKIDGEVIVNDQDISTVETLLNFAAKRVQASVVVIDGLVMLVPIDQRNLFEANAWRLSLLQSATPFNKLNSSDFSWPKATLAEDVLKRYFANTNPRIAIDFMIEHDLWNGFEFKQVPPTSIGMCILSGFDLHLAEKQPNVLSIHQHTVGNIEVAWTYRSAELKRVGLEQTKAWRSRWPQAELSAVGSSGDFKIVAPVVAHRDLVRPLMMLKKVEPKKANGSLYRGRLTGDLSGELEIAIRSLAVKTQVDFYPLPLPTQLGSKQVSVVLKNNTLEECLKLLSDASGIQFRWVDSKIEMIVPKP